MVSETSAKEVLTPTFKDFGGAISTMKELPEPLKADSETSRDSVGSDDQSRKSNTPPQAESPPSHTRAFLDQAGHAGFITIDWLGGKQLSTSTITSSEHSTTTTTTTLPTLEALKIEIKKAMEAKVEAIAAKEATDALLEAERTKSALLSSENDALRKELRLPGGAGERLRGAK